MHELALDPAPDGLKVKRIKWCDVKERAEELRWMSDDGWRRGDDGFIRAH